MSEKICLIEPDLVLFENLQSINSKSRKTVRIIFEREIRQSNYNIYNNFADLESLKKLQSPKNPRDKEYLQGILEEFNKPNGEGILADTKFPVKFAAGGMVYRITSRFNQEYLTFVLRTDKPKLSAMAGYSTSIDEILDPSKTVTREALEEGLMVMNGELIIPYIRLGNLEDDFNLVKRLAEEEGITYKKERLFGLSDPEALDYNLDILKIENSQVKEPKSINPGNVIWNPTTASLDLIYVPTFDYVDISNLEIYDTEKNQNGTPLRRDHVLVPVKIFKNEKGPETLCKVINGKKQEWKPFSEFSLGYTANELVKRLYA
ncbi:MAG: hypothetical protein Q8Q35_04430 [Nanoarchaeota archaeon]|nr:hypothetical protein [Nanoarchaeota archaeon]